MACRVKSTKPLGCSPHAIIGKRREEFGSFMTSHIQKAPSIEEEAEGVVNLKYK